MENKYYFYDYRYYTLEEISDMYKELSIDKRKLFKDSFAHYTLAEILTKCDYDRRMIYSICDLAGEEVDRMNLIGTDCGRPLLGYDRRYNSKLRRLINLTGELVLEDDDARINKFTNGESFLNNLVNNTIGSSYEKDIVDDLVLINCMGLSHDECLAIADNFVRSLRDEEMVFYDNNKQLKK